MSERTSWFRSWFGHEYLAVYPHRDRAEARRAVDLLHRAVRPPVGARALDLACGAGRHLIELQRIGLRATGLDLSEPMLEAARATVAGDTRTVTGDARTVAAAASPALRLVRGDMRVLPFAEARFHVVTSYFTSFGYFGDEEEDAAVLRQVRRVLQRDGWFLLDFLNAERTIANLRKRDRRVVGGVEVSQERRIVEGGRVVEKRIAMVEAGATEGREFVERVRLYRPRELERMLQAASLRPVAAFGEYDMSPFASSSPRYIALARASD